MAQKLQLPEGGVNVKDAGPVAVALRFTVVTLGYYRAVLVLQGQSRDARLSDRADGERELADLGP